MDIIPTQIDDAVERLVRSDHVDGLVCAPDGSAARALIPLHELGISVGPAFPLASCAGGQSTELSVPAIPTIDLRPHEYGMAATQLLVDVLSGDAADLTTRRHRAVLAVRDSTSRAGPSLGC